MLEGIQDMVVMAGKAWQWESKARPHRIRRQETGRDKCGYSAGLLGKDTVAMMNTRPKQLGEERAYLASASIVLLIIQGSQGRKPEAGAVAEAVDQCCSAY